MGRPSDDPEDGPKVYRLPHPETGEILELPRVTHVIGKASKYPLERWKRMIVARELGYDDTLRALALSDPYMASDEALRRGPLRGTAIHGITEMVDCGAEIPTLSDDMAKMTQAYREVTAGLQILHRELTFVNITEGYAGTGDKVIGYETGDIIADVKTSKSVYADAAMQVSAYAHGEFVWDGDQYLPMPVVRQDVALIINVRVDGADLVPIQIEEAYGAFIGMLRFYQWQEGPGKKAVQKPIKSVGEKAAKGKPKPRPSAPSDIAQIMGDDLPKVVEVPKESLGGIVGVNLTPVAKVDPPEVIITDPIEVVETAIIEQMIEDKYKPENFDETSFPKGNTIAQEVLFNKWKDLDARFQLMRDNKAALAELKRRWPEGVPTLKSVRERQARPTEEHISMLDYVLSSVEAKHTEPFPDTPIAKPIPVLVSETDMLSAKSEMTNFILSHPHHGVIMEGIRKQASAAGTPLTITNEKRTMVTAQALKAIGEAVDYGDYVSVLSDALGMVFGELVLGDTPVGALLGKLTYEQAEDLLQIGLAIGDGYVLDFSTEGGAARLAKVPF